MAICSIPAHIKAHSRRAASRLLGDAWHGTSLPRPPFMSARLRQLVFKPPWKLLPFPTSFLDHPLG